MTKSIIIQLLQGSAWHMKQKTSALLNLSKHRRVLIAAVFAVVLAAAPVTTVYADIYEAQIKQLQAEAEGYQIEASKLRTQADSLQNEINALTAQQNALTTQIAATQAQLEQINNNIENTELRIRNVREALAQNLRSLYIEGEVSPIEMAASSNSISDYIDKEEGRNKINQAIGKNIQKLDDLKASLAQQKTDAEKVLSDQNSMKIQLGQQEATKNNLLAQTQGQESAYKELVTTKNAEAEKLREQQRLLNARFIGGAAGSGPACGGGYPAVWCEVPMDSTVDSWGMYNRECVSYTAFKVAQSGRHMPYWGGIGNANQWDDNARNQGIPVDSNPRVGDVAVSNAGYYGHVMYVEAVYGDGTIGISQYNADWRGTYSTNRISASGLVFIHF